MALLFLSVSGCTFVSFISWILIEIRSSWMLENRPEGKNANSWSEILIGRAIHDAFINPESRWSRHASDRAFSWLRKSKNVVRSRIFSDAFIRRCSLWRSYPFKHAVVFQSCPTGSPVSSTRIFIFGPSWYELQTRMKIVKRERRGLTVLFGSGREIGSRSCERIARDLSGKMVVYGGSSCVPSD